VTDSFDWGSIEWLVSRELVPAAEMTFGYVEIHARRRNSRHLHPNCDEVLYLLEGLLDHTVGEDVVRLSPGRALHIPRGVPHQAENVGAETARMVVAYSAGDRETTIVEPGYRPGPSG
jgi:quercetin dioxygenase-like cupin family protein